MSRKSRILIILPLNGGSLVVGVHLADAMSVMKEIEIDLLATQPLYDFYKKSFGHIENEDDRRKTIIEHINLSAMAKVADFRPDLVLVMALSPISPWFIEKAKQLNAITTHWYVEDFRYFPVNPIIPRWQTIAPHYDHFFGIQKEAFFEALKSIGVKNYHYLPTGCNPKVHNRKVPRESSNSREQASDVCFIGSVYPNRIKVFEALRDFDLSLWGPGWFEIPALKQFAMGSGTWVKSPDEAIILKNSKIGLNIHSSLYSDTMIQKGDFLNPRVFTIPACGTFQIVDDQDCLGDVFEKGRDVAIYHDLESLLSNLKYFLENAEERKRMAKRAFERVVSGHTYEHRAKEIMAVTGVGEAFKSEVHVLP